MKEIHEEMGWLDQIIAMRIQQPKLSVSDLLEAHPTFKYESCIYQTFIEQFQLNAMDRLALALSMAPSYAPCIMERLRNVHELAALVGGAIIPDTNNYIPTGGSLLYLMGGTDLERRHSFRSYLYGSHELIRNRLITTIPVSPILETCYWLASKELLKSLDLNVPIAITMSTVHCLDSSC